MVCFAFAATIAMPASAKSFPEFTELVENAGLDSVMTNSFGFGGTNGSMILSKYRG